MLGKNEMIVIMERYAKTAPFPKETRQSHPSFGSLSDIRPGRARFALGREPQDAGPEFFPE
jgi:hypothetical protein